MKTLNIIGAGRVGRTLTALWFQRKVFAIQSVLNRTPAHARDAVSFIGAGRAVAALPAMQPAGVWLLATPDGDIVRVAGSLAASELLRAGDVVFHCSGAMAASDLRTVLPRGVVVASVHPLKSFAVVADAVRTFAGTYCAAEGDATALAVLKPAFEQIGARVTEIDARFKTVYHAASVMVCNYLTALMEAGLQCYEKAGLPRATATAMMEPLVRETVDNVFKLGTVNALTGPIARGDHTVVARQLDALREFNPQLAEIYRALGVPALALARTQGHAEAQALELLERLLRPLP
jgi:predicted short-subunit dehydrogenase-like oxidoreductase (DUF2520 family)